MLIFSPQVWLVLPFRFAHRNSSYILRTPNIAEIVACISYSLAAMQLQLISLVVFRKYSAVKHDFKYQDDRE